ncbi:MAG TPA: helicase-related protein [Oligoflexus sp.]|uniref:helicase-related protein n=1 Tax=Oligoflexus sp. TaxID=1971216 RepID=UPI002D2BF435|nr:helicase-related protein [Oligoflexus sp.]HYX31671.1 helicase-related protein [Oligoflexus sp.]
MSLTTEKRIELTEKLRTTFVQHGREARIEHVPFFFDLTPDEQDAVKKILKKFRSGSHTPETLLEEYHRWKDGAGVPKVQPVQPTQKTFIKSVNKAANQSLKQAHKQTDKDQFKAEKKDRKAAQKRQKNALEIALIAALRENREFSDYKDVFFAARGKKRKLIAFLGPTNSGKTHAAMEAIRTAHSGVYLGPLRLMALENYDRLREKGVKAGLLTGEERVDLEEATHVCQTIETADFNQNYEVAVIDEIQLLTDKDRGGYWLNAVIGIAADVVYLCGAPIVENILRDLAELTGDEIEVIYTERMSPLVFAEHKEDPKKMPESGTAFICFSRKNVLLWKDMLEGAGANVSVVYGALSPEVRKEQSRRFRDGETDYLVATDAVGMGLNLPIHKILFTETEKFDGEGFRRLAPQEVKQIGGRAGRYGIASEAGIITSYDQKDLHFLKQRYSAPEPEVGLTHVHMKPTAAHIRKICESFNNHSLDFALRKFQKIGHEIFSVDISEETLLVAEKMDRIFGTEASSLSVRWFFGIAPADTKNEDAFSYFLDLAVGYKKVLSKEKTTVPLQIYEDPDARLEYAEAQRKNLTVYLWFANKKPEIFEEKEKAQELAAFYDGLINKLLAGNKRVQKKKTMGLPLSFCTECKAMMPPFTQFSVCRDCHANRR